MIKIRNLVFALAFALFPLCSGAQNLTFSTNALEWANLGTVNGDVTISLARRFSLGLNAQYNPWTYRSAGEEVLFYNRHRTFGFYGEVWPWYVNAGWGVQIGVQYKEYAAGGFPFFKHDYGDGNGLVPLVEEGDALGGGVAVKYSHILSRNWSLEFSAGAWAGWKWYTRYRCVDCGREMENSQGFFVAPYNVAVKFVFVIPLGENSRLYRQELNEKRVPYRFEK